MTAQFTAPIFGTEGEQFTIYDSAKAWNIPFLLGQEMYIGERRFRFARAGASALVAGKLYQSEVPDGNFDTLAVPSSTLNVVGSRSLRVTLPAAAIAENLWAQGYAVIEAAAGAGPGRMYRVKSHPASPGSEDVTFTLWEGDGLQTALNTSDTVTFIKNPYADLIIHPSPPTARPAGVAAAAITATDYGWVQVGGPCAVLIDGAVVIGQQVMPSDAVDGAVEAMALTEGTPNTFITPPVGLVMEVAPTTGYGSIWLNLA